MANLFDVEVEPSTNNGQSWAVPTQAVQQVKTAYTTAVAVQQPRSLRQVESRLNEEAALLGDRAYYGWGAGKNKIEGPSHELAVAAARCFGNCAIDHQPVQETPEAYYFTASFIDLETGMTITRPFRQSKNWEVYGKMDEFRKEDIRFQIGASKAARNVILEAVPAFLIDNAMDKAKEGIRAKIEQYIKQNGVEAARQHIMSTLAKEGVTEARVLAKIACKSVASLTVEDIISLQGDVKALHTGAESAATLFPSPEDKAEQVAASKDQPGGTASQVKQAVQAKAQEGRTATLEQEPAFTADPKQILAIAKEFGLKPEELDRYCKDTIGASLSAATPIDQLKTVQEAIRNGSITTWLMETENPAAENAA